MGKLVTEHGPFVNVMSSSSTVYVVPEYQRAYSWRAKKQVAELWSDIVRLYIARLNEGSKATHFIGSVVLGSSPTKALASSECPVIDGQQRLTTLSLIVAAIRDELVDDPKKRAKLTAKYLANVDDDLVEIRLRPGAADRAVYNAIILEEDRPGKATTVSRAYDYVVGQLRQGPAQQTDPDDPADDEVGAGATEGVAGEPEEDGVVEDLADTPTEEPSEEEADENEAAWDWDTLIEVIGTQLELVAISDVAPENAYQIFATLNSTGLELAQLDLIRNAVFMLLPKKGQEVYKKSWTPMEKTMGKAWMEAYLHAWVVRRGHNVPAKETYRTAVYELSRVGVAEAEIQKVIKDWYSGAWSYLLLAEPFGNLRSQFATVDAPTVSKPMKIALGRLRSWGTTPMEPVLLEILERFRTRKLSAAQVTELLNVLESYVARRFIVGTPPNDLRSIFARLTQQVHKTSDAAAFHAALVKGLKEDNRRWPSDQDVRDALVNKPIYRKPTRHCFYVLKRVAEDFEGKESPHIVHGTGSTDYSIEHVLPQNFTGAWQKDLKDWSDPDPQETWSKFRHTVGNLTLTAYNSELADSPFRDPAAPTDKVRWIRKNLRLELSRGLLTKKKWTRVEIQARSAEIADRAVRLWPR